MINFWNAIMHVMHTNDTKIVIMFLISTSFLAEMIKGGIKLDWTHVIRIITALIIYNS